MDKYNDEVNFPKEKERIQKEWIEKGKPCVYREGWAFKGAGAREITKEEATELLPKYHFGKGFYELSYLEIDGKDTLEFNELSVNDMF